MDGIALIANERRRQVEHLGFTPDHDDKEVLDQLRFAAICYLFADEHIRPDGSNDGGVPPNWPWEREAWSPHPNPIRNLVKAGALIAAEIDRLLRQKASRLTVTEAIDKYNTDKKRRM